MNTRLAVLQCIVTSHQPHLDGRDSFLEDCALTHAIGESEQVDELVKLSQTKQNGGSIVERGWDLNGRCQVRRLKRIRTLTLTSWRRIFSRDFFR